MTRQLDTTLGDSSPGVAYFVDCGAILFGLFASSRHALNAPTAKFSHYLRTWLGRFLNRRTVASTFLLGAFNGLLPSEGFVPLARLAVCFDMGETRKLKVAVGDRLLLQANAARKQFINGELVEVKAIQGGALVLADGRVKPQSFDLTGSKRAGKF